MSKGGLRFPEGFDREYAAKSSRWRKPVSPAKVDAALRFQSPDGSIPLNAAAPSPSSSANHSASSPSDTSVRARSATAAPYDEFVELCKAWGLPKPQREILFHPGRKWRFDYGWPDPALKIAVEMDGGIWRKDRGAHGRPQNILRDMAKGNAAVCLGWRVLRYTPEQITSGDALRDLKVLFGGVA